MPLKRPKLVRRRHRAIRQWIEDGASLEAVEDAVPDENKNARRRWRSSKSGRSRPQERQYWAFQKPQRPPVPGHCADAGRTQRWQPRNPIDAFLLRVDDGEGSDALAAGRPPHADSPRLSRRARPAARRPRRSRRSSTTVRRTPGRSSSTGCSPRRITASAGRGTGSISSATPIPAASSSTSIAAKPGAIATTSSSRSTATSRTRSSSANRSPATRYAPATDEAMIATGFLRLGPEGGGGGERGRQDALDDVIATTTLTFTGLTVACARCHNHKFDPIPQKDYYRIQAVFFSTRPSEHPLVPAHEVTGASRRRRRAIEASAQAAAAGEARPRGAVPEAARRPRDRAAARVPADRVEDAGRASAPRVSG